MTEKPVPYPDRRFQALLFDMDGTLLTSIESAERLLTFRYASRNAPIGHGQIVPL